MREKKNEKEIGFCHSDAHNIKSIIEKRLTGDFYTNSNSIYLWANKQSDKNQLNQQLGVITGSGFITKIVRVHEDVKSISDAFSKIKALPKGEKNCFYTFDLKAGTIGKYNTENG